MQFIAKGVEVCISFLSIKFLYIGHYIKMFSFNLKYLGTIWKLLPHTF